MTQPSAKTARPGALGALSDAQLAAQVESTLAALTPRARAFALGVAAGKPYTTAAAEARLSTGAAPISRLKRRAEPALRLLREQARRPGFRRTSPRGRRV